MADSRRLQLRVGLLVVVGLALAVGFTLFFTASRVSSSDLIFETYMRESVQGLDVGAPVRYRGVQIGRVTFIGLVSAEYRRPEGESFVGAFQLVLVRFAVDERRLGDVPSMQEAVRLGLRTRLAAQGITGVNYLELDFVSPERYPPMDVPWGPEFPYVPSIPSTVAQVTSVAEDLLQRLKDADLPELVANLGRLIEDIRRELNGGDVQRVLLDTASLLQTLRRAADGADVPQLAAELRGLVTEFHAAAAEARGAMADMRTLLGGRETRQTLANVAGASAELRAAMQKLPGSLTQIEQTLRSARGTTTDVQAELVPLLRDLRATVGNLRETTEALRRSPSQTLFGAPPPQPQGNRR
jgi:ABC-type transporter Mla subunit MlaD